MIERPVLSRLLPDAFNLRHARLSDALPPNTNGGHPG